MRFKPATGPQPWVAEQAFDRLLPAHLRAASRRYWTPGIVARLGAQWIEAEGARSVLDVGSGAGKFCTLGALSTTLRFCGVEHRAELVEVAQRVAEEMNAKRVSFVHTQFSETSALAHDALYFFNPFAENVFLRRDQLDQRVELSPARWEREIGRAEQVLMNMPVGSLLLTYYRFGGRIPRGYVLVRSALHGSNRLRLWRKVSAEVGHGYWLERDDRVLLGGARTKSVAFEPRESLDASHELSVGVDVTHAQSK